MRPPLVCILALAATAPLAAQGGVRIAPRESLGVFGQWGAFRDAGVPRCYAVAVPEQRASEPVAGYASVGTWPRRQVRGQVHVRLSRGAIARGHVRLVIGGQAFQLTGTGADAWAQDRRMDAAIVAAMRSAPSMSVSALDASGRRFSDRYSLEGAATAMDAATVGCARVK